MFVTFSLVRSNYKVVYGMKHLFFVVFGEYFFFTDQFSFLQKKKVKKLHPLEQKLYKIN